jgi:hypothetical protein
MTSSMTLTGPQICALMRRHRVTIRDIKSRFNVTMKRTRFVREHGVTGALAADWTWMISGVWPDGATAS